MADILIAIGLVSGVGLAAALLLSVISHIFAVPSDETQKSIRACLPGINCGVCGYKGCDDYAAAVAEGRAKPNLCVPGAAEAANAIGDILGIEIPPPKDVVAFVRCNGNCDATSTSARYDGINTCRAASAIYGGPNACAYGCLGLGDCAAACPSNAICMKDGIAHIDPSQCMGCELCRISCPKQVISMMPRKDSAAVVCRSKAKGADARKTCTNACIGCKKCEKACPTGAITVLNNLAEIDHAKCTACGACVSSCPTGCLKLVALSNVRKTVEV